MIFEVPTSINYDISSISSCFQDTYQDYQATKIDDHIRGSALTTFMGCAAQMDMERKMQEQQRRSQPPWELSAAREAEAIDAFVLNVQKKYQLVPRYVLCGTQVEHDWSAWKPQDELPKRKK